MRAFLTAGIVAAIGVTAAAAAPSTALRPHHPWLATSPTHGLTATLEGTVRLGSAEAPAPAMLSPYARRRYTPPAAGSRASSGVSEVIVYVLTDQTGPRQAARDVSIAQRNLTIAPHVTAVQAGTRVNFPNEDKVFHNLFSLSSTHPFNLGRYPRGESRSEVFRRAGLVRMFCDIHSDMSAVVLVLDTPYFTHPDPTGRFRIVGLPEGRHRVVAWHESAGADTVDVKADSNGTATADLRLPG